MTASPVNAGAEGSPTSIYSPIPPEKDPVTFRRLFKLANKNRPQVTLTMEVMLIVFFTWVNWPITVGHIPFILFGLMWGTLMEFLIHRFIQHFPQWVPAKYNNQQLYYLLHGHHHKHPNRPTWFPPTHVIGILVFAMSLLALLPISWSSWLKISVGAAPHLLLFELSHWYCHIKSNLWLLKPMETFHSYHHNSSRYAFGFTSPFWDILAGCCHPKYPFPQVPIPLPCLPYMVSALLHFAKTGEAPKHAIPKYNPE